MTYSKYIYNNVRLWAVIFISVVITLFAASCNGGGDDDDMQPVKKTRITFDKPIIKGISRTVFDYEQVIPYHKEETFRIFGVRYAPGRPNNTIWTAGKEYDTIGETAKWDNSENGWDTELGHYWADGTLYAFRAYSPDVQELNNKAKYNDDASGLVVKGYQIPVMGQQYDFMYSNAVYDVKGPTPQINNNGNSDYAGVNLVFNHALASIHFYVTIHYDYIKNIDWELRPGAASKFKIKQITLDNVYNKGTFKENGGIQGSQDSRTYKHGNPKWNVNANSKGTGYNFVGATPVSNIPFNKDDANNDVSEDIKTLNADAHIGFMIPQDLPTDATLTITWMFDDVDQAPITVNLQKLTPKWERGKRYKYIIKLSRDKFYFDPSVSDMGGPGNDIVVQ